MNKETVKNQMSHDDWMYALSLIEHYVNGKLTFNEMLDVLPAELNLASLIKIAKKGFYDDSIAPKFATMIIDHYYSRLNEYKSRYEQSSFEKLLTVKEVFFLTDYIEITKLVEGKTINLYNELLDALQPLKKHIYPILIKKVCGNYRNKICMMIKPYDSLFNKERYLSETPGYISPEGNISYVTEDMINIAEDILSQNELFPAKMPTEKFIFSLCKNKALENEEPSL